MKYSVVIVTYNRLELLKECLEHVLKQSLPFDVVYVINNNSTDGTTEYLQKLSQTNKTVITFNTGMNLGGAGGFSYGLSKIDARTDYVLIIDDDAIIDLDFIENIDKNIRPEIQAYSGTVYRDGKIDTSHRRIISNRILLSKMDIPAESYEQTVFDIDIATFCGLMVSTKLVNTIGLPMKEYFIWYDDTEYSLRIRKHTRILNVSAARINHKVKSTVGTRQSWKSFYGYRNMWDMGMKYSTIPALFTVYKSLFHHFKRIQNTIKFFLSKDIYYSNISTLHKDVLVAHQKKVLGFNSKYSYTTDLTK